jgi:hypothetical protein
MIEPQTTKHYDLNIYFEAGYSKEPTIYIYELFLDDDGWETDTNGPAWHYYYDQDDIAWTLKSLNTTEENFTYVDEWFTTENTHLIEQNLPPKARAFIAGLPAYEYFDNRTKENVL